MGISISKFRELPINKQVELTIRKGTFVISKKVEHSVRNLYSLSGFYVEIHYNLSDSLIDKVVVKDSKEDLSSYLNEIELDDLF